MKLKFGVLSCIVCDDNDDNDDADVLFTCVCMCVCVCMDLCLWWLCVCIIVLCVCVCLCMCDECVSVVWEGNGYNERIHGPPGSGYASSVGRRLGQRDYHGGRNPRRETRRSAQRRRTRINISPLARRARDTSRLFPWRHLRPCTWSLMVTPSPPHIPPCQRPCSRQCRIHPHTAIDPSLDIYPTSKLFSFPLSHRHTSRYRCTRATTPLPTRRSHVTRV